MKNGFALLMVMVILILMGTEMFVLTSGSNKITFQTNQALLEATQQNLISSGFAWAEYNVDNKSAKEMKDKIWLDPAQIGTRVAQLGIAVEKIQNKQALIIIDTACSRGRENLKCSGKYQISLRNQ